MQFWPWAIIFNFFNFEIVLMAEGMWMLCFQIMHVFGIIVILWQSICLGRTVYRFHGMTPQSSTDISWMYPIPTWNKMIYFVALALAHCFSHNSELQEDQITFSDKLIQPKLKIQRDSHAFYSRRISAAFYAKCVSRSHSVNENSSNKQYKIRVSAQ